MIQSPFEGVPCDVCDSEIEPSQSAHIRLAGEQVLLNDADLPALWLGPLWLSHSTCLIAPSTWQYRRSR